MSMMPEITRAVGVPRTLTVSFGLGCPFGSPGDADGQTQVLTALLRLCERTEVPVIESFR